MKCERLTPVSRTNTDKLLSDSMPICKAASPIAREITSQNVEQLSV
jgi:hypothetical protein